MLIKALFAVVLLLLSACRSEVKGNLETLRSAESGLRVSVSFLVPEPEKPKPLPAAVAGVIAGSTLMEPEGGGPLPFPERPRQETEIQEDIELMKDLIELLSTDVQLLLNRAIDRADVLDDYIRALSFAVEEARSSLRRLSDREEELDSDERRLESSVDDLRDELADALQSGQAQTANTLAQELIERQGDLAQVQTELVVVSELVTSLDDTLVPLEDRLSAVQANRDALLAGVIVIDLPGIEDLGILEIGEGGRARIRRRY